MTMRISKEFKFDSAHNLINYHGKCENLHGHTYRLRVTLEGTPADDGMIIDFGILKTIVTEKVVDELDHKYINDIIEQSTAENIVTWIWNKLETPLQADNHTLVEIKLWETEDSFITLSR